MPSELINVEHPFYNSPSVQGAMLFDVPRTTTFEKAIQQISKNKDILEIGTGTGILSLIAAKAGARSVTATEAADETFNTAKETIKNNNLEKAIDLVQYKNKPLKFKQKFDVIMSECLGHFAFDENMVSVVAKYKKHLKKDGVFLPSNISLFMTLVDNADFYAQTINNWNQKTYGFDFSAMRKLSTKRIYIQTFDQKQILSSVAQIVDYDLKDKNPYLLQGEQKITVTKDGLAHGFAGWFTALLAPGVEIDTSPSAPSTHWEQCFMPFLEPLEVKKGDVLEIKVIVKSNEKSNKVKFNWYVSKNKKLILTNEAEV